MKTILTLTLLCLSLPALAQFRSTSSQAFGSLITPTVNGSIQCAVGHTSNGFTIFTGDGTNPQNSTGSGLAICRLMGVVSVVGTMVALPGGNYRSTTDIDPAVAPCRFEGTVSATTLTAMTCGVDP